MRCSELLRVSRHLLPPPPFHPSLALLGDFFRPMNDYTISASALVALGTFVFLVFTWWFRHLVGLAERHDLQQRRRLAAFHYLAVTLLLGSAMVGTLLSIFFMFMVPRWFVAAGFVLVLLPAIIWWVPRIPTLKSLGYGRRSIRSPPIA